jgi:hypothetical protein
MGCWICHHQVVSAVGEAVGTCSVCWIHACDDHGERLSGAKFKCAIETAKVRYASLVFASPATVPVGSGVATRQRIEIDFELNSWGTGSALWARSAPHRDYWRRRIQRVMRHARNDPNSPWFDARRFEPFPDPLESLAESEPDRAMLMELADLVGLVAWYLGLRLDEPYPSLATARDRAPAADAARPRSLPEHDERADPRLLALTWLFGLLRITPAEVVYLLRYYADTDDPRHTSPDWDLGGELYERLRTSPFLT